MLLLLFRVKYVSLVIRRLLLLHFIKHLKITNPETAGAAR